MNSPPDPAGASTIAGRPPAARWPVRALLLGLVLTCLIPGAVGVGVLIYRTYQEGRTQIEHDTIRTARALVQVVDGQLDRAKVMALALALALSTSNFLAARNLAGFHRRARALVHRSLQETEFKARQRSSPLMKIGLLQRWAFSKIIFFKSLFQECYSRKLGTYFVL